MSGHTVILSGDTLSEKTSLRPDDSWAMSPPSPQLRQRPRVHFQRSVLAIPVGPDGGPEWDHRFTGHTTDIGLEGIGLEFPRTSQLRTLGLVLTLAAESGKAPVCLGVDISNPHDLEKETCRIGGHFSGFAHDLLKPENLTPRIDARLWQFEFAMPEAILDQWAKVGILEPILWDRVQLCPRCHALPTFRRGCTSCGSIRLANDRLIHHFPCAHVGLISEFEEQGQLVCPKCRTRHLVIGADYEYMTGPFRCGDCLWTGTELEQVAQCLRCQLRFPVQQSYEQELKGYRANRLDPLALLPSPGTNLSLADRSAHDRCPSICVHENLPVPLGLV